MHCNDSLWPHPDNFILIIQYIISLVIVGPKMYSICIHVAEGRGKQYLSVCEDNLLYCLKVFSQTTIESWNITGALVFLLTHRTIENYI